MDSLEDYTPEKIAQFIFSQDPLPPCSCQVVFQENMTEPGYIFEIFEILNIILLEGMEMMSEGLNKFDFEALTKDHLLALNPWFHSLGFDLKVELVGFNEKNLYKEYYCKIVVRDKLQEIYFEMKNIPGNYTFYINGDYFEANKNKTSLQELYSILVRGNDIFIISFDLINNISQ
jgi:hypothetical protein